VPRIVRNALLAATLGGVLITGVGATSEATNLRLPQIAAAEAAKAEASAEAAPTEGGTPAEGQAAESADYNSAQLSSTTETGLSNSVGNHEKPGFPESVPQSHLDWKIETNNLDFFNNGYYITSTASAYKNGEWILNNSLENATLLDSKQLSEKVNQIDKVAGAAVTGNMVLDASGSASFKLPVQAATTLYGLIITGIDGNPIDINSYQVYGLADGTFEVKVALGSTNARSAIQIKEVLVESDESVHATQHIPAIDLNKLNEDALNLLKYSDADLWDLSEEVGGDTYSINPSNKNILDQTDGSPESFINAAVKLTGKDCDTANAEFALLSSNLETPDDYYVNMAFGYSGTLGPNGDIGFLDSVSAHAFTVATDGSIIDATPAGAMSDDPMTQQYLANLGKAADSDKEAAWNQQSTNLSNQDSQRKQDLKKQADQENKRRQITLDLELMLGLGLAAGGLSLAPKGAGVLRRNLTSKKINSAVSKVMPGRLRAEELSIKELEEAYRFFNWLSFGGGKNFPADSLVDGFQNAPELLGKMQGGSLSVRRIKEYLRNPKQFEQAAGVTNPRILRQLAKYVIVS
jgi:hypothetical protein